MLDDVLDPVEEAWLEDVCVLAADSELYCDASVTTEVAMKAVVEIVPSASVTVLCRVEDSVVNEVGAAAVDMVAGTAVSSAVTEVEI